MHVFLHCLNVEFASETSPCTSTVSRTNINYYRNDTGLVVRQTTARLTETEKQHEFNNSNNNNNNNSNNNNNNNNNKYFY